MKYFSIILLIVSIVGFNSCKLCKKDKTEEAAMAKLILKQGFVEPTDNSSTDISSISIEGNILTITVSYSGGCQEHEFELYFDGTYKKSLPPKVNFILVHDNKNDNCRSIVEKKLQFDISQAQYKGQNEIMVTVGNLLNEVSYKY